MSSDIDNTPSVEANLSSLDSCIENKIQLPWARLYSTITYLEPIDLTKESFSLGRLEECDVTIVKSKFPRNRALNISKQHFIITKEDSCLASLTDMSKNGTFVNGKLVGKNNKCILQNDDEIAIGYKDLKVYIFKTVQSENELYLPVELRNKYVVSRKLGQGACGEVRLVFEKTTCKSFAVKKIKKAKNVSKVNLLNHPDRIDNEIKIMCAVSHPCVISVHEIVDTEEFVFIVLEYMEGGELTDRILSVRDFPEHTVKFVFYQVALAVQYLHRRGITHRDIKPENILLLTDSAKPHIKVSDFGLSKIVNEETVLRTLCGTPYYLAPEVWDSDRCSYDQKVDVWSLGVILFYMLSRELPFKCSDKQKLTNLIMTAKYDMNSKIWETVSTQAKDLIQKILVVDPQKRPSIDEVLKHPWIYEDLIVQLDVIQMLRNGRNESIKSFVPVGTPPPVKKARFDTSMDDTK